MGTKNSGKSSTEVAERVKVTEPKLFRVYLLNDDYTTMDFVVNILETVFNKAPAEAVQVMMHVHKNGRGLCGIFPKQIAETKVVTVHQLARARKFPLKCIMEENV